MHIGNIEIRFEDSITEHNLVKLFSREKGTRFYVDSQNKLCCLNGFFQRLWYWFNKSKIENQVSQAVARVVSQLTPERITCLNQAGMHDKAVFLSTFYFEKMASLSQRIFDRSLIPESVEDQLMPSLAISKNLLKSSLTRILDKKLLKEQRYFAKVEAVRLALNLGIDFERLSDGSSGAYLGRNRLGQALIIFKPNDEEPFAQNTPKPITRIKNIFKVAFPVFRTHQNVQGNQGYLAEVGASIVDDHLNLNIVPKTHVETFLSKAFQSLNSPLSFSSPIPVAKVGSCQLFKKHCRTADEYFEIPSLASAFCYSFFINRNRNKILKTLPQALFEKLVILDFIIGNLDRHGSNWLIKKKDSGITKLFAIDNGLSFYFKHPQGYFSKRYQYLWALLPQAKIPFSQKSLAYIMLLEKSKNKLFEKLQRQIPDFNNGKKQMMEQRINALCTYVKAEKTPAELALLKSSEDFQMQKGVDSSRSQ